MKIASGPKKKGRRLRDGGNNNDSDEVKADQSVSACLCQSAERERFLKFVLELPGIDACWGWIGCFQKSGHPLFRFDGRTGSAHRFAYKEWIGPIPEGYDLHHTCENRWCVNPQHLEPLPHGDHTKKHHPTREFCIRGHALTPDNCLPDGHKNGRNRCRECCRLHDWCLRHGLRITEFDADQLAALVGPRKYRVHRSL